ncbi:MAG TPA: glycosyltransferase [Paraburkholderia sp.]|nr:glycosyltransferase [Paraburkholderia sp.]
MSQDREVIFHIPNLLGGGAERVAVEIARHFSARGVSTIFFVHKGQNAYALPKGVEVVVARRDGHLGRLLEFRSLIRRRNPDAVLSFLPYANLISLFANFGGRRKVRLVLSEHLTVVGEDGSGLMNRCKWFLRRHLYQRSDAIVAVSEGVANDLRRTLAGDAIEKIVVIYNPCFIPDPILEARGDTYGEKTILAVGRLCDDKGYDVLISAFSRIRSKFGGVKLIIAGEGPSRKKLEKLIADLDLTDCISLPGFTSDIRNLYRNADLFVCSSRREGFGNVFRRGLNGGRYLEIFGVETAKVVSRS